MKQLVIISLLVGAAAVVSTSAGTKDTYEKECARCHGSDGKGDTKMGRKLGAKDYTDPKFQETLKDDHMFKTIKEGLKEGDKTKMKPAEGLSDDEIKALVAYMRAFKK
ncbi:MAG: c-type cytochrome [Verrucomicrobia bacterium]|nr:c-type cytochrome [Verrucomicrobiota bacterium]